MIGRRCADKAGAPIKADALINADAPIKADAPTKADALINADAPITADAQTANALIKSRCAEQPMSRCNRGRAKTHSRGNGRKCVTGPKTRKTEFRPNVQKYFSGKWSQTVYRTWKRFFTGPKRGSRQP